MKKCQKCHGIYQGNNCECGFTESKKQHFSPRDEWVFKRWQELHSWREQAKRMQDYLQSATSETMQKSIIFLLNTAENQIKIAEERCGISLKEVESYPHRWRIDEKPIEHRTGMQSTQSVMSKFRKNN